MASDLELVLLAFDRVRELSLIYGHSISHLISTFNELSLADFNHYYGCPDKSFLLKEDGENFVLDCL